MTFDDIQNLTSAAGAKPVVVMFYGLTCGPCRGFKPTLRKVCDDMGLQLEEVNVASEMETIKRFGIRAVPTVVVVDGGKVHNLFTGVVPEQAVVEHINKALDKGAW